jgi:predicted phosphodiesterase
MSNQTNRAWTEQEVILLKMLRPTHSNTEVAQEFERRADLGLPGIFARSTEAIEKKCKRDNITAANTVSYQPGQEHQENLKQLEAIQSKYAQNHIRKTRGLMDPQDHARKIVSISDLHVPFMDINMLEEVVEEHASPATWLVINGDALEGYSYSHYTQDKVVSGLHEFRGVFELVKYLRTKFGKVFITSGNHDKRVTRSLNELGWPEDKWSVLGPDLLARIANGEELDATGMLIKKHDFDNVFYEPIESWYIRIGKTVFFHPSSRPGSKPGDTVNKWARKFLERYDANEVDSFVCGHTHKVYEGVINGYKMMEQGTLAGYLAYAFDPKALYDGNGQNGYAVIYQDQEGNTDFNYSHVFYLGEIVPPKKSVAI